MLPVQPYRPGRYPPGPRWAQFGDDQLAHSTSIAHEARGKLAAKRQEMVHFHIGRLQEDGYLPAFEPGMFQTNRDPAEQGCGDSTILTSAATTLGTTDSAKGTQLSTTGWTSRITRIITPITIPLCEVGTRTFQVCRQARGLAPGLTSKLKEGKDPSGTERTMRRQRRALKWAAKGLAGAGSGERGVQ